LAGVGLATALRSKGFRQRFADWQSRMMTEMMDHLPEEHPARIIMADLRTIREQNERIIGLLEGRESPENL
ncbi:MAG TPA: hypothetical protein VFR55_10805, partial [Dehalococcoidia bacterium]|nr:hypothetical protein [Dehalococcoidia bacterium]